MKLVLSLFVLVSSVFVQASEQDPKDLKAIAAARALYAMNITHAENASFAVVKRTCGGEDGTQVCVLKIRVKEKDDSAGVTSYQATFMNAQLQKLEQSCKYCW